MKFEEYQKLGAMLKEARAIMFTHERPRPKTKPINKFFDRAIKHIDELRCWLEEMLFQEYPDQATTDIFY